MACPDDNTIAELMQGLLPADRRREIESHMHGCSTCASLVVGIARTFAEPEDLPSGARFGRYQIEARLGRGGMGTVYAARDPLLDRRVALKVLHHSVTELSDVRERILREGRALARLSHPNVVAIYDVGEEDGRLFLTMELVAGATLRAWLRDPRPWREVLEVFVQAAEALAAAHAAGVVHGDFKPDNVIVAHDRRAFVMDFGLARFHAPGASDRAPQIAGTPAYMAPEQLRGASATPASDQFSFCLALREALPAAAPGWVLPIALRGLDPDPARRWPSMKELAARMRKQLDANVHYAINAVLQLVMVPFHVGVTTLFLWAFFSADTTGPHKPYAPTTEILGTIVVGWLVLLFFSGWAPAGVIWAPINAYGLFRKRRWAVTSSLIYSAVAALTCFGTPAAIYALATLWPLRKKTATSR
ncbi:MAG TPA: serine/threonine-protein kinase [Polyangiaceae bacterium]|jgi:predicted Ser/Thr protein kinase